MIPGTEYSPPKAFIGFAHQFFQALWVFNVTVQTVASKTPQCLPALSDFIGAPEWQALKDAALLATKALK